MSGTERSPGDDRRAETTPLSAHSLPRTTATAIAVATALGSLALLSVAPLSGAGAIAGVLLGTGVRRFTGGIRELLIGSALLPAAGFGLVAGLGRLSTTPLDIAPAALGVVTGVATVAAVTDVTDGELQRVGWICIAGAVVVGGASLLASGLWSAGGVVPFLAAGERLFDDATVTMTAIAVIVIAGGIYFLPPAAITTPRRDHTEISLGGSLLLGFIAWIPLMILAGISRIVRLSLFVLTLLFGVLGLIGLVVGASWRAADHKSVLGWIIASSWADGEMHNPALGVILSLCGGSLLVLAVVYGAVGTAAPAPTGMRLTAVVMGGGGVGALVFARVDDAVPDTTTILAGALGLQALIVAGTERVEGGIGPTVDGLVTLVVLTAALFVYTAGQYGNTVAREVGTETARRPQLVWLGWSGVVGVVGLLAAAVLYLIATTFTPVLSGPSRIGVLAGLAALAAVTWLLLDG